MQAGSTCVDGACATGRHVCGTGPHVRGRCMRHWSPAVAARLRDTCALFRSPLYMCPAFAPPVQLKTGERDRHRCKRGCGLPTRCRRHELVAGDAGGQGAGQDAAAGRRQPLGRAPQVGRVRVRVRQMGGASPARTVLLSTLPLLAALLYTCTNTHTHDHRPCAGMGAPASPPPSPLRGAAALVAVPARTPRGEAAWGPIRHRARRARARST